MQWLSTCRCLALSALALFAIGSTGYCGERPIEGAGSGALDYQSSQLVGGGNVSHLGTCSVSIYLTSLDLGMLFPYLVRFDAANGDALIADVILTDRDEAGALTGMTIRFRGVSGRFEDASGIAHLDLFYDSAGWDGSSEFDFDFTLEGMIDY